MRIVIESIYFKDEPTGFESKLCHLTSSQTWAGYITSCTQDPSPVKQS